MSRAIRSSIACAAHSFPTLARYFGRGQGEGPSLSQDQPPQLDYAPPSPWHRRRSARRVLSICFITLAGAFVVHWTWQAAVRAKTNYYFWESMKYQVPPEQDVRGFRAPPFEKFYRGWG